MQIYSQEAFASLLTRTFFSLRPRVIYDTTDKGEDVMEFLIENPRDARFSVSLQAKGLRKQVDTCTLWFGQAEISGRLTPDMAPSAIATILNDELVAILRYKHEEAYDNHRPVDKAVWLYQLTDDEDDDSAALEKMEQKLASPPTLMEKLSGKLIGVFEVFSWSESRVIKR